VTLIVVEADTPAQVTVIGQLPAVVREPTVQLQLTLPEPLLVAGLNPDAVEGPLL